MNRYAPRPDSVNRDPALSRLPARVAGTDPGLGLTMSRANGELLHAH
jgi:hypothetical protein